MAEKFKPTRPNLIFGYKSGGVSAVRCLSKHVARDSRTSAKLDGQERFSAHFLTCNAKGLMFDFA